MFCPNCGKDCGDANFCSACGRELAAPAATAPINIAEPPIGIYEGIDGCVELSFCTMSFHKKIHSQIIERTVSYDDIIDVEFQEASKSDIGFLAIREKNEKLLPVETETDAAGNETALLFEKQMNEQFCNVYSYLKQYASAVKTGCKSNLRRNSAAGICCPKCKSTRCFVHVKEQYRPFMRGKSVIIALLMIVLYVYQKLCTKSEEYICLDCGHRWELR